MPTLEKDASTGSVATRQKTEDIKRQMQKSSTWSALNCFGPSNIAMTNGKCLQATYTAVSVYYFGEQSFLNAKLQNTNFQPE